MKDTTKHLKIVGAVLLLLAVTSCQKEEVAPGPQAGATVEEQGSQPNEIELGEQLENPYSVANMQKALESLQKSKKHGEAAKSKKIRTTHLYIKFEPKTEKRARLTKTGQYADIVRLPLGQEHHQEGRLVP